MTAYWIWTCKCGATNFDDHAASITAGYTGHTYQGPGGTFVEAE